MAALALAVSAVAVPAAVASTAAAPAKTADTVAAELKYLESSEAKGLLPAGLHYLLYR